MCGTSFALDDAPWREPQGAWGNGKEAGNDKGPRAKDKDKNSEGMQGGDEREVAGDIPVSTFVKPCLKGNEEGKLEKHVDAAKTEIIVHCGQCTQK